MQRYINFNKNANYFGIPQDNVKGPDVSSKNHFCESIHPHYR